MGFVVQQQYPGKNPFSEGFSSLADALVDDIQRRRRTKAINSLLTERNQLGSTAVGQALNGSAPQRQSVDDLTISLARQGFDPNQFGPILQALRNQETKDRNRAALTSIAADPSYSNTLLQGGNLSRENADFLVKLNALEQKRQQAAATRPALSKVDEALSKNSVSFYTNTSAKANQGAEVLSTLQRARDLIEKGDSPWTNYTVTGRDPEAIDLDELNNQILGYLKQDLPHVTNETLSNLEKSNKLDRTHGKQSNLAKLDRIELQVQNQLLLNNISQRLLEERGDILPDHESTVRRDYQRLLGLPPKERSKEMVRFLPEEQRRKLAAEMSSNQTISSNLSPVGGDSTTVYTAVGNGGPQAELYGQRVRYNREGQKSQESNWLGGLVDSQVGRLLALGGVGAATSYKTAAIDLPLDTIGSFNSLAQSAVGIDPNDNEARAANRKAYSDRSHQRLTDPNSFAYDYEFGDELAPNFGAVDAQKWLKHLKGLGSNARAGLNWLTGGYFEPRNTAERVAETAGVVTGASKGLGHVQPGVKELGKETIRNIGGAIGSEIGQKLAPEGTGWKLLGGIGGFVGGRGATNIAMAPSKTLASGYARVFKKRPAEDVARNNEYVKTAEAAGTKVSPGMLTENRMAMAAENTLGKYPFVSGAQDRASKAMQRAFRDTVQNTLHDISPAASEEAIKVATGVSEFAVASKDKAKVIADKLWDNVYELSREKPFYYEPAKSLEYIEQQIERIGKRPSGPEKTYLKRLEGIKNDAKIDGLLSSEAVKDINALRYEAGEMKPHGDISNRYGRLKSLMQEDLKSAAVAAGEESFALELTKAEQSVAKRNEVFKKSTAGNRLVTAKDPEKIYENFNSVKGIRDTKRALLLDRENGQKAWDDLRANALARRFAKSRTDGQFSLDKFVTDFTNAKNKALYREMLNIEQFDRLDKMAQLGAHVKKTSRYLSNPSDSGIIVTGQKLASKFTDNIWTIMSYALGSGVTPKKAWLGLKAAVGPFLVAGGARLLHDPKFQQYFTRAYQEIQSGKGVINFARYEKRFLQFLKAAEQTERYASAEKKRKGGGKRAA